MNKLFTILILCITLNSKSFCQENDSIPFIYDIGIEEFNSWNNIYNSWRNDSFFSLLKNHKIKLNCSDCESFYAIIEFQIKDYKIESYKFINENFCGRSMDNIFKSKYLDFFLQYSYPEILNNKSFKVRIGDSLKC